MCSSDLILPFAPVLNNPEKLLQLAASVESKSEHPIGKAIVKASLERQIDLLLVENFVSYGGSGVKATFNQASVVIGRPDWLKSLNVDLSNVGQKVEAMQKKAYTVVAVIKEKNLLGLISVADELKPDSVKAIRLLRDQGMNMVMITGDNLNAATVIGEQLDIDQVIAEVLPEEKLNNILKLKDNNIKVGMVGDGINDAPALAQADVGFAIGSGTDVAIESADVILTSCSLSGVSRALNLSRATMKTVRQNLFWAFFYNVVSIPLAVVGFLHPVIAESAMALSSITVVTNVNLLRRARIKPDYAV